MTKKKRIYGVCAKVVFIVDVVFQNCLVSSVFSYV